MLLEAQLFSQFHVPQGPNLDGIAGRQIAAKEASKGLEALPHMAEIWPLGGGYFCRLQHTDCMPKTLNKGPMSRDLTSNLLFAPPFLATEPGCFLPSGRPGLGSELERDLHLLLHETTCEEEMGCSGAGDRLGLECEVTGKSVPTAMLPYCGRTLLEGLMRDLQVEICPSPGQTRDHLSNMQNSSSSAYTLEQISQHSKVSCFGYAWAG